MNDITVLTVIEPYLQKALESIANQTFRGFEYPEAGIVPVSPDEGGFMDIVDTTSLTYRTDEDAARILTRLLDDEAFRREQLRRCKEPAKNFSIDHNMTIQHRILDSIMGAPA